MMDDLQGGNVDIEIIECNKLAFLSRTIRSDGEDHRRESFAITRRDRGATVRIIRFIQGLDMSLPGQF